MTLDSLHLAALPPADRIQFELADVDERFHIQHGPDDSWLAGTWDAYDAAINDVWTQYQPPAVEVAA
ncbi:hypothetical protein [Streptomyces smyrnaeus]|uniref:hypothetical protein n=1 Tax=Streptomyces smyrnaeus TaxID=1387713 RepID=UPI0033C88F8B